uniref:Serine aminopeptidase S33 domain-containing protein n=1 Tax=Oryza glumipatula TaxID=40148 RepID=A0A0D9YSU7_9ORYZ
MAFFLLTPPSYALVDDHPAGVTTMTGQPHRENIEVLHLRTRRWNTVVAVYVRHLDAATTLLYSHGNAADLGHLYQLFLHLSFNLRVNVLGFAAILSKITQIRHILHGVIC